MKRTTADQHASNLFQDENLPTTAGTLCDASWFNNVQEEIANVVEHDGTALDGGDYTQLLAAIQKLAGVASVSPYMGDRSDGSGALSGTMVRDIFYDTLTVNATLNTNGWVIRARRIVINVGGVIHCNGADGLPNSGGSGGPGGTAGTKHRYLGFDGGAGGAGDANGIDGEGGFGFGGNGGAGGGAIADGGDGGVITDDPLSGLAFPEPRSLPDALGPLAGDDGAIHPWGGGGGGGGGAGLGGGGGAGGGAGGRPVLLVCEELVNNGLISSNGGAGASATTTGHGAGGGGGGLVALACGRITGSGTVTVTGGAAGTGSVNGTAGSDGQIWYLLATP